VTALKTTTKHKKTKIYNYEQT